MSHQNIGGLFLLTLTSRTSCHSLKTQVCFAQNFGTFYEEFCLYNSVAVCYHSQSTVVVGVPFASSWNEHFDVKSGQGLSSSFFFPDLKAFCSFIIFPSVFLCFCFWFLFQMDTRCSCECPNTDTQRVLSGNDGKWWEMMGNDGKCVYTYMQACRIPYK